MSPNRTHSVRAHVLTASHLLRPVYAYSAMQVSLSLTTGPTCTWSISSPNNWISIPQTAGIGSASVNISAPANTGASRTGVVNAAGKFLTIYQPGPTCTPSVAPSQPVGPAGGAYTLNVQYVNGGSGCAWNAVSQSSSVRVTGAATGAGNGVLSITVDPNNTVSQRQLTLSVGGQSVTLTQGGQQFSPLTSMATDRSIWFGRIQTQGRVRSGSSGGRNTYP